MDIGGRGPAPGWVLLGKGCGLNATARRTQSLHPLEARSGGPLPTLPPLPGLWVPALPPSLRAQR